jgi:hypothetical protein
MGTLSGFIRTLTWLLGCAAGASLPLQAESSLLQNSPFLPTGQLAGTTQEAAPLELRSIIKDGGRYEFSLYDSAKKRSTWVTLQEPGHDFLVKAFDPANDAVTVEHRSRTYTLTLRDAKIIPLAGFSDPALSAASSSGGGTAESEALSYQSNRRLLPNNPAIARRIELQREALAALAARSSPEDPPN